MEGRGTEGLETWASLDALTRNPRAMAWLMQHEGMPMGNLLKENSSHLLAADTASVTPGPECVEHPLKGADFSDTIYVLEAEEADVAYCSQLYWEDSFFQKGIPALIFNDWRRGVVVGISKRRDGDVNRFKIWFNRTNSLHQLITMEAVAARDSSVVTVYRHGAIVVDCPFCQLRGEICDCLDIARHRALATTAHDGRNMSTWNMWRNLVTRFCGDCSFRMELSPGVSRVVSRFRVKSDWRKTTKHVQNVMVAQSAARLASSGKALKGTPGRFQCNQCSASFKYRYRLLRHHEGVHTRVRHFECDLCKQQFTQKAHLRVHCEHLHGRKQVIECEICGSTFKWAMNLKRHKKLVHLADVEQRVVKGAVETKKTESDTVSAGTGSQ